MRLGLDAARAVVFDVAPGVAATCGRASRSLAARARRDRAVEVLFFEPLVALWREERIINNGVAMQPVTASSWREFFHDVLELVVNARRSGRAPTAPRAVLERSATAKTASAGR